MNERPKTDKKEFIIRYGLLYALCLFLSLGAGFIAAAAMAKNTWWEIVWPVFGGITLLSLVLGFLSASAVFRKYSK